MPNIIPFDQAKVPAHLAQRIASNAAFMAALPATGYPVLGVSGTRFMLKVEGKDTPILDPQTGAPVSQLPVILLGAKEVLDRNYYVEKYDPNQTEAKTADCFSRDGVRPDPSFEPWSCRKLAAAFARLLGRAVRQIPMLRHRGDLDRLDLGIHWDFEPRPWRVLRPRRLRDGHVPHALHRGAGRVQE